MLKNTPFKLHHIHQGRGVLRTPSRAKMEISAKIAKDFQSRRLRSLIGFLIHVIK